ncbi:hypothetical protein TNCV_309091 [Trichonephila clavipes]|nr:hypothetical protein TNCV_309091 [Trichonephila clavipes]
MIVVNSRSAMFLSSPGDTKISRVEELLCNKSVEVQSPHVGMKFQVPRNKLPSTGMDFTPRVTLPGEYSRDVLRPFHPVAAPLHNEATYRI